MSSFYDIDGNTILNIPFPEEKFSLILKKLNYLIDTDFREAPFEKKRIVLLVSFREFLSGHLFLEEFCEIANHLTIYFDPKNRTEEQAEYEQMIYEAAEISLYVRNQDSSDKSMFAGFMVTIWDYFKKYKYLLDELVRNFPSAENFENPRRYKPGEKIFLSMQDLKKKIKEKGGS